MIENRQNCVYRLWDELTDFPASQVDQACLCLLKTLSNWLDADNGAWIGAVRLLDGAAAAHDALSGWRVKTITFLHPPNPHEALLAQKVLANKSPAAPGMPSIAMAKRSGTFRVHRLHDGFIDLDAYRQTVHYRAYYDTFGVDDRLWVASPINPQVESYFVFDKRRTAARFAAADAELAAFAVRGLKWLQRRLLYSHGLLAAQSPLTPAERQVVQLMLTDKSEKEIAAALGISAHTTHGHVKEIFRKFGVQGRAGLMAVWLSHH